MPTTADTTTADGDFARQFGDGLEWVTDPDNPPDDTDGGTEGDDAS